MPDKEMIRRVARAIQEDMQERYPGGFADIDVMLDDDEFEKIARVAIEAMREPTKAMVDNANYCEDPTDTGLAEGIWKRMIEDALD